MVNQTGTSKHLPNAGFPSYDDGSAGLELISPAKLDATVASAETYLDTVVSWAEHLPKPISQLIERLVETKVNLEAAVPDTHTQQALLGLTHDRLPFDALGQLYNSGHLQSMVMAMGIVSSSLVGVYIVLCLIRRIYDYQTYYPYMRHHLDRYTDRV